MIEKIEIKKHSDNQFVLTVNIGGHPVPALLTRKKLVALWNDITAAITCDVNEEN